MSKFSILSKFSIVLFLSKLLTFYLNWISIDFQANPIPQSQGWNLENQVMDWIWRGNRVRLWRCSSWMVLLALQGDVQPLLRLIRVLGHRQLHIANQPQLRDRQWRPLVLLQVYRKGGRNGCLSRQIIGWILHPTFLQGK